MRKISNNSFFVLHRCLTRSLCVKSSMVPMRTHFPIQYHPNRAALQKAINGHELSESMTAYVCLYV